MNGSLMMMTIPARMTSATYLDEDHIFDVGWNTWPLQSVPEVKRLLFNILASPRSIFSQDVPVCHFYNLPISHICMIARLGQDTFNRLGWILSQNLLLLSPQKPQHPIKYQLAAFPVLYCPPLVPNRMLGILADSE